MKDHFFETTGYLNGSPVCCPLNAYGDCPCCDKHGHCRMTDPVANCDDFAASFPTWEDWFSARRKNSFKNT